MNDVANTIARQIHVGKYRVMVGAHNVCAVENGLAFSFKAKAENKANIFKIVLENNDTYTLYFMRLYGMKLTQISMHKGVYWDQINSIFESETKLRVSL
jgi:hypothetical protein